MSAWRIQDYSPLLHERRESLTIMQSITYHSETVHLSLSKNIYIKNVSLF